MTFINEVEPLLATFNCFPEVGYWTQISKCL